MDKRKRSLVWTVFSLTEEGRAKCGLCEHTLSFQGGATSNMMRHIKFKHQSAKVNYQNYFQPKSVDECLDEVVSQITVQPTVCQSSTPRVSNIINKPVFVQKNKELDNQLVKVIVKEFQPFSLVEDKEFQKFVNMLNPKYALPSKQTLSSEFIPDIYNRTVEKIKNELKPTTAVSITTDGWTSTANDSFLAVTAHFITEDCELKSYLLDCFQYNEKNSADTLATELIRVLSDWDVIEKVSVVVSDNTANIKSAIKKLNWKHISCFAHTINVIVEAGLQEINSVQEKVKSVVEFFRRTPQAAAILISSQKEMDYCVLKLKHDVPKRWNTTHEMFLRFVQLKEPLLSTLTLVNPELNQFSEEDWLILEKACNILEVFQEVTMELSSEKYVSLSKVIVVSHALMRHVAKICQDKDLPDEIKNMASVIKEQLLLRFAELEANPILADSTILDPRFKSQGFHNETSLKAVCESLQQRVTSMQTDKQNQDNEATCSRYLDSSSSSLWEDFDFKITHLYQNVNPKESGVLEVEKYLQEPHIIRTEDPLLWWRDRKTLYPHLFEIMKSRLCIPATSVPCERLFSKSGQELTERRNRLSSSKVAQIMFLNVNI